MEIQSMAVGDLSSNCYFIICGEEVLIVDPGQDVQKVIKKIKEIDKKTKKIILTHYHPDHSQESQNIKTIVGAQILAHREDVNFLNFIGVGVDQVIKDGDEILIGDDKLKVIHTPGHTEGSICLLGDDFIITGDTLFENGHGRTDLPGGSPHKMKKSLEKIKKLINPQIKIYPGHGKSFYLTDY